MILVDRPFATGVKFPFPGSLISTFLVCKATVSLACRLLRGGSRFDEAVKDFERAFILNELHLYLNMFEEVKAANPTGPGTGAFCNPLESKESLYRHRKVDISAKLT